MLFSRKLGLLFITISAFFSGVFFNNNIPDAGGLKSIAIVFGFIFGACGGVFFFVREMALLYAFAKKQYLMKNGTKIIAKDVSLVSGFTKSYTSTQERNRIDRRIEVNHLTSKGEVLTFLSDYFWLTKEQVNNSFEHGVSVISAPKNIYAYYIESNPSIHYIDISFLGPAYLLPERDSDWLMDGILYLIVVGLWVGNYFIFTY